KMDHARAPVLDPGAGTPSPAKRQMDPGSIVVGRPSPGFVGNPGPAERLDPRPVTIVVGPPVGRGDTRTPDPSVGRIIAPGPVVVQFSGDKADIRGNVAIGLRLLADPPVAFFIPA